ncbi:MAG: HAMP domain-containing histidine kinase [Hamadaea sp.]|uniref:HAMP domain-containing sensor histidine kinase n=1 Tax=Hamadaea sp. TaxID=2024425 RepID=UPI0017EB6D88|nr:HAMP domain-containing sensor histidine kinase [Hamadaea sp.]NUT24105.1 HAMP domain-containing histidine kinase [Hamadaea sp.]
MRDELTRPLQMITPPRSRRVSLVAKAAAAGAAVALISVLVTALVAIPIAVRVSDTRARQVLAEEAQLVTEVLRNRIDRGRTADEERLATTLRKRDVEIYLIRNGVSDRAGLPESVVRQISQGHPVSRRMAIAGRLSLVEGRPIADGDGVVLTAPAATGTAWAVLKGLWLPLGAGLLAGVLAGVLLARRLTRPLRNAAVAAARIRAGDHAVRVPVEDPPEVADLASALNELAGALAVSEARQREFLLSISHELKTPLTTLRGYAEALADGVVQESETAPVGRTMIGEADHLARLIDDLLALARLDAVDFPLQVAVVDLVPVVRAVQDAWQPRCTAHGVPLRVQVPDGPLMVTTDAGRLRQVIDGLLENALRVVPPGKPIVVELTAELKGAIIQVRDGGPGFTDDDLAVAFERGALHQRYQGVRKVGSGLGLALAAGLVRRLGGTVSAGHAPEGGAALTVTIPR